MTITKREIGKCIVLSFLTCGIYAIYWEIMLAKEALSVKDKDKDAALYIILMIFLPFLGSYMLEKEFHEGCINIGYNREDRSITYLLLGIFCLGIVNLALIQKDLNVIAEGHESGMFNPTDISSTAQPGAAPQFAGTQAAASQKNEAAIIDELKKYKELLDSGVITQAEFDEKKAQLLKYM